METTTLANTTLIRDKQMQTVEFLQQIPSIARVIWTDQTSSSGSWAGIIVEKASGNTYNLLEFFQEFSDDGMKIFIGNPIAKKIALEEEQIEKIISEYADSFYFPENDLGENTPPKVRKKENSVSLEIPFE